MPANSSRLDNHPVGPKVLFCYGTLQFDAVLEALLGRIPERAAASAPGYRTAALADRVYPGLVRCVGGGPAPGVVLTDLSNEEWRILDAFEDERYDLLEVTLSNGQQGRAYVWPGGDVCPDDWDAAEFQALHLEEYAARCARLAPNLAAGLPKGEVARAASERGERPDAASAQDRRRRVQRGPDEGGVPLGLRTPNEMIFEMVGSLQER